MTIKRILVPTDFSDHSLKALDYAIDFARSQARVEIVLLHVIEPIRYTRFVGEISVAMEQQREEAAEQIAALEKRARERHARCRSEVQFGVPYQEIVEAAEKSRADLIIIATHGTTGLAHLLLGSVAERVVQMAKCPVLIVRSAQVLERPARRPRRKAKAAR